MKEINDITHYHGNSKTMTRSTQTGKSNTTGTAGGTHGIKRLTEQIVIYPDGSSHRLSLVDRRGKFNPKFYAELGNAGVVKALVGDSVRYFKLKSCEIEEMRDE